MARDYYETLGVSRNSSKEEIKQAYRRLARKYHPDVNKDPGAEERFKEINRAYEILSDDELRARFDRYGEAGINPGAAGMGGMGFDPSTMSGFADIFESFFGGIGATQQRARTGPVRGDDLRYDLTLDFLEAVFGGDKQIRIKHLETCEVCGGSGAKPGTSIRTCSTCGGIGQVRRATRTPFGSFTQVSVCPTCNGTGQMLEEPCHHCGGEGLAETTKKLRITIPAGVDSGTRLRVSGEGDAGRRGGPSGDLYVYLFVDADKEKLFQRDGITIHSEVKISYLQAILGGKVAIPTVDSRAGLEPPVTLEIPPGSQPGTVLTLEGKGVPKVGNPVARGDHKVTVVVEIPTRLSHEERELLEKLAELHGQKTGKSGGFLGGLFNFAHRDE